MGRLLSVHIYIQTEREYIYILYIYIYIYRYLYIWTYIARNFCGDPQGLQQHVQVGHTFSKLPQLCRSGSVAPLWETGTLKRGPEQQDAWVSRKPAGGPASEIAWHTPNEHLMGFPKIGAPFLGVPLGGFYSIWFL